MATRLLWILLFIIPFQAFTQCEVPCEEWNSYTPQSNWLPFQGDSGAPSAQFRDEGNIDLILPSSRNCVSGVPQPLEKAANLTEGCTWLYPNYFQVGYTGGEGISYRKSFGTMGLFLAPTYFTRTGYQPFVDGKFYFLGKDKTAASAGLGVRTFLTSWNKAIGINAYYDYRRMHHFDLHQVGVGVELLGEDWDIRINGYFPLQETHHHKLFFSDIGGGFIAARRWGARAWTGVDSEIGTWFFKKDPCSYFGLYFAAGPYYYATRRGDRHVFERKWHRDAVGGRARVLAKVTDFIDISVCATYDSNWHTRVQGTIMLTLPLDCCFYKKFLRKGEDCFPSYPCNQVLIQPVVRNGIIVADQANSFEWNWSEHCSSYSCGPTSLKIGFGHSEN